MNKISFEIIATGSAAGEDRITNDDLTKRIDTTDEWIRSHTGIGARHIARQETSCSTLAVRAVNAAAALLAEKTGEGAAEIKASFDVIVLATTSADYIGFPPTACVVQNEIGAKNALAFDISAACTGFIYGIEIASAMLNMRAERKRAVVIASEILSRVIDWEDRSTCVLFGDGAAAVIIEKTENTGRGLLRSILGADGGGARALYFPLGSKFPQLKKGMTLAETPALKMDGHAVYNFAVRSITETIEKLAEREGVSLDDIKWIVPHQANDRIVRAAQKRLRIADGKFFMNIEEYGNTSAASIGIALDELNRAGKIKRGDLIMMVGFGAGLTYGGNLIVW